MKTKYIFNILAVVLMHLTTNVVSQTVGIAYDVNPGTGSSLPYYLTIFEGKVFFNANDGSNGSELWVYDGTNATLLDINPGPSGSNPEPRSVAPREETFVTMGNFVYFIADNGTNGIELWRTDGTTVTMIADINPGAGSSEPKDLFVWGDEIYFSADNGTNGYELYKTDGTTVTPFPEVRTIPSGNANPHGFTPFNGELYFTTLTDLGHKICKTDGLTVTVVHDVSSAGEFTVLGNELFFIADRLTGEGRELFKTDGTTLSLVADINPGASGSDARFFTVWGNEIYFVANNGTNGYELWKTDGTTTTMVWDIEPGAGNSYPNNLLVYNNRLYFNADNATTGKELCYFDGTNGTIIDSNPGTADGDPRYLSIFDNELYYAVNDGTNGTELWKTDGTTFGLVVDIWEGSTGSMPQYMIGYKGELYFSARTVTDGYELRKFVLPCSIIDPVISVDSSSICDGSSVNITVSSSQVGVDYQLTDGTNDIGLPVAGTGADITFTHSPLADITYIVEAVDPVCDRVSNSVNVTVGQVPDNSLVVTVDQSSVCAGTQVTVTVVASELGVNYQLTDGTTDIGTPKTGTGGNITFTDTPSASTTYTVEASIGTCIVLDLVNTVAVTVTPWPNTGLAVTSDATTLCEGSLVNITLAGSELGVSYQLTDGTTDIGGPQVGTGGNLTFPDSPTTTTTYKIKATSGVCTDIAMTDTVEVTVDSAPDNSLSVTVDQSSVCAGTQVIITIVASESGVSYQLTDGTTDIGTPKTGTGADITFTDTPSGDRTYTVEASNGSCVDIALTDTEAVTVTPGPNTGLAVTADATTLCEGSLVNITLAGSELGVSYQLTDGTTNIGSPQVGTGGDLIFTDSPTLSTVYTIDAVKGLCSSIPLSNRANVALYDLPDQTLLVDVDNSLVCTGEPVNITLNGSENGIIYTLESGGTPVGSPQTGNGGTLYFPVNPSVTALYNIVALKEVCNMEVTLVENATVTVNPLPSTSLTLYADPDSVILGEESNVIVASSESGVEYQLLEGSTPVGASQIGTGGDLLYSVMPTKTSTFQMEVYGVGCILPLTLDSDITVVLLEESVAVPDIFETTQLATSFDLLANDTIDGDVYINLVTSPLNGDVSFKDGILTYTPNPKFIGIEELTYEVCSKATNICTQATVTINVTGEAKVELVSPIITLNNDGINDVLQFSNLSAFPNNELAIFNRWGNQIYHANPYTNSWGTDFHGTGITGIELPVGTYYYILKLDETKTITGFFELLK
jgi:gliding motility-associated-like protein